MVRMVAPGILTEAVDNTVTTKCEVGTIGNTSIEFRYQILFGEQLVAHGVAMMILVGGTPGTNLPPMHVTGSRERHCSECVGYVRQELSSHRRFQMIFADSLPPKIQKKEKGI